MNNDFPRMVYKAGGPHEIHGGKFDYLIAEDADELDAMLADGWHLTTDEAREAPERERRAAEERARVAEEEARAAAAAAETERQAAEQAERDRVEAEQRADQERAEQERAAAAATATTPPTDDNAPPTRAELEAKANELGVEFSPRIGDAKLFERIEAALAAKD